MKLSQLYRNSILAAAFALGLAAPLHAADPSVASGLLGQRYAALSFGYVDLDGTAFSVRAYRLAYNQSVAAGLDARLELDYLRSDAVLGILFGGGHYTDRDATVGLRAYTRQGRATPYAEAGAGWTWFKLSDWGEDSFLWYTGVGVELAVHDRLVVTPYIRYLDRPTNFRQDSWHYGVKGQLGLTPRWGLTLALDRDNDRNLESQAGVTWKF